MLKRKIKETFSNIISLLQLQLQSKIFDCVLLKVLDFHLETNKKKTKLKYKDKLISPSVHFSNNGLHVHLF